MWSHLYVESKRSNPEKQELERWLRGMGGERNGEILVKRYKLPAIRLISSGGLMYSNMSLWI